MSNPERNRSGRAPVRLALLFALAAAAAWAQQQTWELPEEYDFAPALRLSGTNTMRWEYYRNEGNNDAEFHPSVGPQFYDELRLDFSTQISPYESCRGSFSGLYNNSEYRDTDEDVIPEHFNLLWEKGDAPVPLRLELGDFFGFYTFRTMQKSLKGAQLELQPGFGAELGLRHSMLLTAGAPMARYDEDNNIANDFYHGVSWLVHADSTDLSFNLIRNTRQQDSDTQTPDLRQIVYSVAGNHRCQVLGQNLTLEGEVAYLDGDPGGTGAAAARDVKDVGCFFQASGRSQSPLTYKLRFEDYDRFFSPNGGVVTPDRRTWDSRLGWRFNRGLTLNGRLQKYTDAKESANPTDTDVVGLNLAGPALQRLVPGLNLYLDGFVQTAQNEDGTTNSETQSVRLDLNAPLAPDWTGRLGLSTQRGLDKTDADGKTYNHEVQLSTTRRLTLWGLSGGVTPGIVVRSVNSRASEEESCGLSLAANLAGKRQAFDLSYRMLQEDPHVADSVNTGTHTFGASYTYSVGPHSFAAEVSVQERNPEHAGDSRGYRAGLTWTFRFGKPSRAEREARGARPAAPVRRAGVPAPSRLGPPPLADLAPGMSLAAVKDALAGAGVAGGAEIPGATVYETVFFDELSQRQRLVVVHEGGRVARVGVVIDLADAGDPATALELYERVRRTLIRRYGRPETFERGAFTANLADDVNSQRVIRLSEWRTAAGVIRLGFPRRLDGQIRIEVQHADSFPPPTNTLWGLEQVR